MVFLHHQTIMVKFNLAPNSLFGRVLFRHILISGSSATRFLCSLRCVVLFHSRPGNIRYHNQVHHAGPEGWNLAWSPLIRLIPDKPLDQAAWQNPLPVPRRASYRAAGTCLNLIPLSIVPVVITTRAVNWKLTWSNSWQDSLNFPKKDPAKDTNE